MDNIPVIIQFHGGSGTSKEAYYREGNLNGVADSEGILMIYPQADINHRKCVEYATFR